MKTNAFVSAAGLVLTLPLALQAATTLTVPDGQYRLIAGCRLQEIDIPQNWLGPTPVFDLSQYYTLQSAFATYTLLGGSWVGGPRGNMIFSPGEGAIAHSSGGSINLSFQQKAAPKFPLNLQPGFNLVCCQSDVVASFEDIVGTSPANGTLLYQFNAGPGRNPFNLAAPDYTIFTFANGAWSPTNPVVGITEAVFVYQPPQLSNVQVTVNGISFEITTPLNQQFVIEYTDSLAAPSWHTLTNFVGTRTSVQIKDLPASGQRFYRARSSN